MGEIRARLLPLVAPIKLKPDLEKCLFVGHFISPLGATPENSYDPKRLFLKQRLGRYVFHAPPWLFGEFLRSRAETP